MTPSETSNEMSSSPLHSRMAELISELDASRGELRALVASLPPAVLAAPAQGEEWSIAEILEHLTLVEDGAGRLFSKIVREVETSGEREANASSILSANDAFKIATSNVRITAPERVRPTAGLSPDESMARLEASRDKLKSVMTRASGLALESASMPHPIFGPINGYQWALVTAQHERRHIRQIRRMVGIGDS